MLICHSWLQSPDHSSMNLAIFSSTDLPYLAYEDARYEYCFPPVFNTCYPFMKQNNFIQFPLDKFRLIAVHLITFWVMTSSLIQEFSRTGSSLDQRIILSPVLSRFFSPHPVLSSLVPCLPFNSLLVSCLFSRRSKKIQTKKSSKATKTIIAGILF